MKRLLFFLLITHIFTPTFGMEITSSTQEIVDQFELFPTDKSDEERLFTRLTLIQKTKPKY